MSKFAIVGVSCLFPGASDTAAFWRNLTGGVDSRREGDASVFGIDLAAEAVGAGDHGVYCTRGGFISGYEFDPTGYRLPPEYLTGLDRVFHWTLHVGREALADSGYAGRGDVLGRTGLVFGNYAFPTLLSSRLSVPLWQEAEVDGFQRAGVLPSNGRVDGAGEALTVLPENLWVAGMPARVAGAALGLRGPQYALDAACSSALYSIKLACDHLSTGSVDLMLAGGVCAPDAVLIHLSFSDLHAYPQNGVSQPFDTRSTGILTGQGAGMFALKRLADAQRDGDRIYAVIDGIGLTNDGAGKHLLSPNANGQLAAYEHAYASSGIEPGEISYVECHATGTPLGDSTEIDTVGEFFGRHKAAPLVGSVKANIGHLLTVAGLTSMLKVLLAMQHDRIPPTIGIEHAIRSKNGVIGGDQIVTEERAWPDGQPVKRAGISAFGFGGTNAHVVMSEPATAATAVAEDEVQPTPRLAIAGMGCHFGPYDDLDAFARAVLDGDGGFRPLPEQRWRGFETTTGGVLDRAGLTGDGVPAGAYLDGFDVDPLGFRIPPRELGHFNEQQLLALRVADEAMHDAGFRRSPTPGHNGKGIPPRRVAVVVAMEMEPSTHGHRARYDLSRFLREQLAGAGVEPTPEQLAELERIAKNGIHDTITPNEVLSYIGNIMASRISWLWNLTGPSFTISADSGSSARALEIASLLLLDETIEAVLVGAVDLAGGADNVLARTRLEAAAVDAAPGLSFGVEQERWRIGEGAGAVVVMRPERVPEGQRTYASIDAVAIRCPEPGADRIVPGADADVVREAAEDALAAAGVGSGQVGYVEAHASGVAAEDAAELRGLARVYSADRAGAASCALGSATSQIGGTQNAAALAGVIRAALCLYHGYIPGNAGWSEAKPEHTQALESSAFYVPADARPWLRRASGGRRVAAVSSVGSGGTHGHIVLSSDRVLGDDRAVDWERGGGPVLLPVAADGIDGLLAEVDRYRSLLAEAPGEARRIMREAIEADRPGVLCAVFVAANGEALVRELEQAAKDLRAAHDAGGEWTTPAGSYFASRPIGPEGKVAFVFPGAFNSYLGLGQNLFRVFPALLPRFESQTERPSELFRDHMLYPRSLTALDRRALGTREAALLEDIPFMLATGTSMSLLYTDLLREIMGLKVHGALGYSLGESSMMFAMGGWDQSARTDEKISRTPLFQDRLAGRKRTVREHWDLPDSTPDSAVWATHVVLAEEQRVRAALPAFDRVFLTHVNTPQEVVVAGDPAQVKVLIEELGARAARAPANHVMHVPVVDGELDELAELNRYPTQQVDDVELFTALTYDRIERFDSDAIAAGIAQTLRSTIDFPRLVRTAYERGYRYFIEVGAGATCTRWVRESLGDTPHVAAAVDRRGLPAATAFAQLAARLVSHGVPLDLKVLLEPATAARERPAITRRVVCGGEPVASKIAREAAPIARELQTAMPVAAGVGRTVPAAYEGGAMPADLPPEGSDVITVEGEPFTAPWVAAAPPPTTPQPAVAAPRAEAPPQPAAAPAAPPAPAQSRPDDLIRDLREQVLAAHAAAMKTQVAMQEQALTRLADVVAAQDTPAAPPLAAVPPQAPTAPLQPKPPGVVWDEAELLEFATGSIARVFGPEFAPIDAFSKRVRLPAPPYLFATRVTALEAETGKYEKSFIRTEYDVPVGAWYAVDGQVPPAVTIEAGQCDLLLISYLGIDFQNQGKRVYRLLDSTLSFSGDLPREGQTLRYDISIDRFVSMGETLLFFFSYTCFADGEPILALKDACAGFFTQEELDSSLGVVITDRERAERSQLPEKHFKALAYSDRLQLGQPELALLAAGRIADVFGPAYDQDGANPSLRLPQETLRMVDEIAFDPTGGSRGFGSATATKALEPDAWYFTSHFSDDPVLAGSLVAEGAVQILQSYSLFLGMHLCLPDARFQPVAGLETSVKVRGQITPDTTEIRYELDIVDLDLLPRPRVVADVLVYKGDKPVVSVRNLGIEIREKPGTPFRPEPGGVVNTFLGRKNSTGERAMLSEFHMAHAAKGDLSVAMGPEFEVYATRRAPYIPNGRFLYVDRVMGLEGTRGVLKPGAKMTTEYDSPAGSWYYRDNGAPFMPNVVYMESSLQSAILLGYYLGATLPFPENEFSIRNLDGHAKIVKGLDLRDKTIRQTSTLLSSSAVKGAILQNFAYELSVDGELFYTGESLFGYFAPEALVTQAGLDAGTYVAPWIEAQGGAVSARRIDLRQDPSKFSGDGLRLGDGKLRLVDWVDIVEGGGDHAAGYIRGRRTIEPDEWYFENHFYRDPVMPGSLGVEAVIQGLQLFVMETGLAADIERPRFAMPVGVDAGWKYRGQILRTDGDMDFDLHVKEVRREADRLLVIGDASLWKPGLRIYELKDVAVEVREEGT